MNRSKNLIKICCFWILAVLFLCGGITACGSTSLSDANIKDEISGTSLKDIYTETIVSETSIPQTTVLETAQAVIETITEQITAEASKHQTTTPATSKSYSSVKYPLTYSDETCSITIIKEWYGTDNVGAYCYAAHIKFTDFSRLKTDCANGDYNNGYEKTTHAHNRLGAILTVNGCHSSPDNDNPVMRSGTVYNNKKCDVPAVYSAATGLLFNPKMAGISDVSLNTLARTNVISDTFCFLKPYLIGEETFRYGGDKSRAQRTFIGTNGNPGDMWIVVSEGRNADGKSAGLTYLECAEYLKSKGCTFGVPLDGGGSSTMVFQGEVLNHLPNGKQRAVVDFLYFK